MKTHFESDSHKAAFAQFIIESHREKNLLVAQVCLPSLLPFLSLPFSWPFPSSSFLRLSQSVF